MKKIAALSLFVMLAAGLGQTAMAAYASVPSEWVPLFNGKDLTNWDGDPRLWSVKDGAIRGETTEQNPARNNTFCIWRGGMLDDFELKIKFRIQSGNSGIQYRSKEFDKWRIGGYQAEVANFPGQPGFLYDEAGRASLVEVGEFVAIDNQGNKKVVGSVNDSKAMMDAGYYKDKDWNEYLIVAQGNHIIHYLNGFKTIELIDNDRLTKPDDPKDRKGASRGGLLALQIHVGPPMVVEFKDILLKRIPAVYGDAILPFDGQSLDNWATNAGSGQANKWVVGRAKLSSNDPKQLENVGGTGQMINMSPEHGASQDIYSKAKFGDCRIELEVMVPKESNSGIYLMGEYEVQVLDSYGHEQMNNGDMGAIYDAAPPAINASKRPGEWQQYVIEWRAPKFGAGGKKVKDAEFLLVELNGKVLHKNVAMGGPTPGGLTGKEASEGPLMFQGNHGPVAYRNIVVTPLVK
jgi:hypothetical protein